MTSFKVHALLRPIRDFLALPIQRELQLNVKYCSYRNEVVRPCRPHCSSVFCLTGMTFSIYFPAFFPSHSASLLRSCPPTITSTTTMADDLSEALEDSLLSTIDLQLDEIDEELEDSQLETDEDFALAAWRRQLQAWKADTEAESPNISATRITKRAADLDIETPQKKRRGKRATKVKPKPEEADCDICTESFPIKSTVPLSCCGTRYCKSCLESWFHASLESKCVPKCCGNEFEPENFYGFIPQKQQLQRQYDMVKKELDADDKSYCCHPECGAFIGVSLRPIVQRTADC